MQGTFPDQTKSTWLSAPHRFFGLLKCLKCPARFGKESYPVIGGKKNASVIAET